MSAPMEAGMLEAWVSAGYPSPDSVTGQQHTGQCGCFAAILLYQYYKQDTCAHVFC